MSNILILTENQKVVVSYVVITIFLINKTQIYLRIKNSSINKNLIKKNFLIISRLLFNIYIYTIVKEQLTQYKRYLIVFYLLKFFNVIELVLFNFIAHYTKIVIFKFGYFFYIVFLNSFLQVFWYLFPNFSLQLNSFLFFLVNQFKFNLVILKAKYPVLFFSFSQKTLEIILFLFNSEKLIDIFFYTIKFILLFIEIILAISLVLFVPPIRELFFYSFKNKFQNWDFQGLFLRVKNYINTWLTTFYKQKNVWHKIFFALMTIFTWLLFIIIVIKNFIDICTLIKSSIDSF